MAGKETARDVREDPVGMQKDVLLKSSIYKQEENIFHLCPQRQLVADSPDLNDYVYDGCGNTLYLLEDESGLGLSGQPSMPFIRVGVNKKLRFKNIRILNGSHLDDSVYLASGSSYTAATEDGVILEGSGVDSGVDLSGKELIDTEKKDSQPTQKSTSNFSVDFQAIAPELTFYDGTRWPANIALRPEKLLRAKLDLNLLLAMKGSDTWLKASAKGMMLENAAGLAVLEPLDAVMDYVCAKGETKLDLTCTDIALRVPLNVVRLMQRLSADLLAALKLGGGPVTMNCTQFHRLWQSPSGSNPSEDLTFWRPIAKTGYAILGDCVTAGKNPPLLAVIAVNKGYRRVRNPRNFELLWSSGETSADEECCVWLPNAGQGYVALGCVVTKGRKPPNPTTVSCVREDLLTSSSVADCVFYDTGKATETSKSGPASIWRVENSVQSFLACRGLSPPPLTLLRDFRPELLIPVQSETASSDNATQETPTPSRSSTMEQRGSTTFREPTMTRSTRSFQGGQATAPRLFLTTPNFERIWWDKGGPSKQHITIWRPHAPPGYAILGDTAIEGFDPPDAGLVLLDDIDSSGGSKPRLAKPVDFALKATLSGKGWEVASVWFPTAPPGYVALGCVAVNGVGPPSPDCVRCVRTDLVNQKNFAGKAVWSWSSGKNEDFSFWPVDNQPNTFIVHVDKKKPPWRMAYSLAELEKPKQPDNLDAQINASRVSLTLFDDFSGVMTPLMDLTVNGIHLTAHGRPEALNAFVLTSAAASTYNTQLGVWEPLVEPFEGAFKYESRDDSPEGLAADTHARIHSTTVLDVNITSAAIDTFGGAALTWTKTEELEQAAQRVLQQSREHVEDQGEGPAVDREEGLRLMVENQLGATIYARTAQDGFNSVQRLSTGRCTALPLPPLQFPELLRTTSNDSRPIRRFIALRIKNAKDLIAGDDVSGQEFVCVLTVLTSGVPVTQQLKQLPQTARSRGVKPSSIETDALGVRRFMAAWDEVFVIEVPSQGTAKLDLRILNQAANNGKGLEVATLEIAMDTLLGIGPKESNWSTVKAALSIGHNNWSHAKDRELPLMPSLKQVSEDSPSNSGGRIVLSDYVFTVGPNGHIQTPEALQLEADQSKASDAVLQLAPSPEGPWTGMRTMTAIITVPIALESKALAVEMSMRQGLKCLTLRSLAVLMNSSDILLDVCICPSDLLSSEDVSTLESVEDEVFENQRYSPLLGWGSAWPGHLLPSDPGRYSAKDLSNASQELTMQPPTGWQYVDSWNVDRSLGDSESWFYGPDFKSLKGVSPESSRRKRAPFDFVRRRRLVRTRQRQSGGSSLIEQSLGKGPVSERLSLGVLEPGVSMPLPWSSLLPGSDWYLQLRPHDDSKSTVYKWSQVVVPPSQQKSKGKSSTSGKDSSLLHISNLSSTKEVDKKEELLECQSAGGSWWLCIEADPSRLHGDVSGPVMDWRLTVRAPLKLENRLPCVSEYLVWEKTSASSSGAGRSVKREHGLVNAGEGVHIYSTDIRSQIRLTWLPQGGWKHEKDTVVISDPWAADLPGNFWIVNALSSRRLRVSVENDMGGNEISAKIVRLFVPYWLQNDTKVPLFNRLVEIEPLSGHQTDSLWLQVASKAAKNAGQLPAQVKEGPSSVASKVLRSLQSIENPDNFQPVMLSLPNTENVGLSVALNPDGVFDKAIALRAFEDKVERVDLNAVDKNNASYMKLSVALDLSSLGYDRTKVIRLQPHTIFKNYIGQNLFIRQVGGTQENQLTPTDVEKVLPWESKWNPELLQIRIDGCDWSYPFGVDSEGTLYLVMKNKTEHGSVTIRAEICNGVNVSRFSVHFRLGSYNLPYKIENRSLVLPIRFRQTGTSDEDWELLPVGSALPFTWIDVTGDRLLEVMVDGAGPGTARQVDIDNEAVHEPSSSGKGAVAALQVAITRESSGVMCVKVMDWRPSSEKEDWTMSSAPATPRGVQESASTSEIEQDALQKKFYLLLELEDVGISIVDHTREELLYISMQGAFLSYESSVSGLSRIKVRVGHLQIDNQLPLTPLPVLLSPKNTKGSRQDYVLKLTITSQRGHNIDEYPYIGLQLPNEAWLVNIHEPIIWRLHSMVRKLNLGSLSSPTTTAVAVDPLVAIRLLNISESRIKLTLAMAPSQRPRGVLGFWPTLLTSLGNTDEMLIHLKPKVFTDIQMRKSQVSGAAISAISNDLLSQPFQLLSGLDFFGNASSAFGHMSEGVAALSMDNTFIRSRQTQESKGTIEGLGDGLREGGEALAKGLFRGFTGILTKPVEGAQASGVEGFVTGVGRGIVGAAAQPVSGVLDLVSKTTDGVNASRLKLSAAMSAKAALKRQRLPRAISGENILRPFDQYSARGQVILLLAERGALFGATPFDIKERSKFALSDAYENHFNLPGKRTFMITNQRCMLLQVSEEVLRDEVSDIAHAEEEKGDVREEEHPSGGMVSKQPDLLKDPCTIMWDVTWNELMTMELKPSKEDLPSGPPSRLMLHLRDWSQDSRLFDSKHIMRMVQCHPRSTQAIEIKDAVEKALQKYGPDRATVAALTKKRRAESRPYTGAASGLASGAALGLLAFPAAPLVIPVMATFGALVGGAGQVMLENDIEATQKPSTSSTASGSQASRIPDQTSTAKPGSYEQAGQIIRSFKRVWWDKGALWSPKYPISIWRPVPPPGFVSVGDLATAGYDQPEKAMVYRDDGNGKFALPDGFDLIWRDTDGGAKTPCTIWMPRPPPGYVAVGCVAEANNMEPEKSVVRCVRRDCTKPSLLGKLVWRDRKGVAMWKCSIWPVVNDARSFIARRDHECPKDDECFTVTL